jgi:DNA-binding HxlR family transcriptional regulator
MGAQVSSLLVEYRSYMRMNCSRKEIFNHVSKKWAPYMISKLIK